MGARLPQRARDCRHRHRCLQPARLGGEPGGIRALPRLAVRADPDPGFEWCRPPVAHIRWDYRPVVRRVVRWTNNVALGKDDRRQSFTKAEFVDGGTIGPVAGNRMVSVE